jgi:3-phenylpropionate/cinnamic acid dioxygenase small subunit
MTIEELIARECIRQTLANYNIAGDRMRVEDFVAVFTEDAVFESAGGPESQSFRHAGRRAIRDWISNFGASSDGTPQRRPTFVRHHLTTCQIELTGADTASARTYWAVYSDNGPDHCGYYVDAFRKTGEQWLIAHRKIRVDWLAPQSLFKTTISRPR